MHNPKKLSTNTTRTLTHAEIRPRDAKLQIFIARQFVLIRQKSGLFLKNV